MQSNWYQKWHDSHHHRIIHWAIFLLIVIGVWVLVYNKIEDWISIDQGGVIVKLPKSTAQISLSPQTTTVSEGQEFSVDIILDTANQPTDGVDLYSLHYDPTLLSVIDDVPNQKGTQIMPGTIMEINAANEVSAATGAIKFSQLAIGGTHFTGKGTLATVHFKALAAGTAYLKFDFVKNSTVDTNVAFKGKDQLARVVDGIYTITAK